MLIDFGETYHKAKQDCTHLGNLHDKIENLLKDPNFFIYEKINDLKNEVKIKSKEMKLRIDKETNNLIQKLTKYQAECKKCAISKEYMDEAKCLNFSLKVSETRLKCWNDFLNFQMTRTMIY